MIVAIWGKEGEGKTSMALTFPKPLAHFDLDVGGYDRASWRLDAAEIVSRSYPLPIQLDKLTGPEELKKVKTEKGITVKLSNKISGYRELWQKITNDFVVCCQDPKLKTIVIDSATQLWTICHVAELQLKQEIQLLKAPNMPESELRERLQPVEFPNERMRQVIYTARSTGKNLVLTHYPRNIYKEKFDKHGELVSYKSDDVEPDGFKDTVKLVDVVVWIEKGNAKISIKCGVPGLGMSAVGMALPEASYSGIMQLQKAMKGE